MDNSDLLSRLKAGFRHIPTLDQEIALEKTGNFIAGKDRTFILKGYAGTGKTSLISALVKSLKGTRLKIVLLAPTGRAAKVLTAYTGEQATTIHKKIYKKVVSQEGAVFFSLHENLHTNTIFVVDEASMLGLAESFRNNIGQSLLGDVIEFVSMGNNCKLFICGDTAQLPPIGSELSPALDPAFLEKNFEISASYMELKDVVRQRLESGILYNATKLRNQINLKIKGFPSLDINFPDVYKIDGSDLEDALNDCFSKYGSEGTIVICRSNKRTNQFNQQIRARIKWLEEEISAGDQLMVVKNNYFWLPDSSRAGFIANGDMAEVLKVRNVHLNHGFRFAELTLQLMDYPEEGSIETKVLLDVLTMESPSLTGEQLRNLYNSVLADYESEPVKSKRSALVRNDPYLNALQIKFGYAVTCHKAQGGQWNAVFIDQGYLTEEMIDVPYLRWLYTAITRATEKVYFVNFNEKFFNNGKIKN